MKTLQPGDWVICISNTDFPDCQYPEGNVVIGHQYKVLCHKGGGLKIEGRKVLKGGHEVYFDDKRFEPCEPPPPPRQKPQFQVGQKVRLTDTKNLRHTTWLALGEVYTIAEVRSQGEHLRLAEDPNPDAGGWKSHRFTPCDPPPLSTTPTPIPMNSNDYDHIPVATPTLVYGRDIAKMSDEQLIDSTQDIQGRIDKLRAIPGRSRKIARQISEAQAALDQIVAKLDADEPVA